MDVSQLALQYPFAVLPASDGETWEIVFPDLPGVVGQAESVAEIGPAAIEALAVYLDDARESGDAIPPPDPDWDPIERTTAAFEHRTLTTQDVAAKLGLSTRRVTALAHSRELGRIVGRQRMFAPSEVDAMRERRPGRPVQIAVTK